MKCGLKHCFHPDVEVTREDGIRSGNRYYHKDCFHAKENVAAIAALYSEEVDSNVVWSQLMKVINTIVYTRNVNSDYVLFALRRYIQLGKPLNYPSGLYYVINNKDILKQWKQNESKKIIENVKIDIAEMPEVSTINHKPTKAKGFGSILKAGGNNV